MKSKRSNFAYQALRNAGMLAAAGALGAFQRAPVKVKKGVSKGLVAVAAKKKRKGIKKESNIIKRIKKLENENDETLTKFINKSESSTTLYCNQGLKTYYTDMGYQLSSVLDTVNNAQVWDRATSTWVNGGFNAGVESKSFTIDNVSIRVTVTSASTHPVKVRMFIVKPKTGSANNIGADIIPSFNDISTDALAQPSNICYDIYENSHLKKTWSFSKPKTVILQPGQQTSIVYTTKSVKWSDEVVYNNWDKRLHAANFLLEFVGLYGHRVESGAITATAPTDSRVVVSYMTEQKASYDGGIAALRYRVTQGSNSGTAEGVYYNSMITAPDMITNTRI